MANHGDTTIPYGKDDLEYFAEQLQKSGNFHVIRATTETTSTPLPGRLTTFNVTPTPEREHAQRQTEPDPSHASPPLSFQPSSLHNSQYKYTHPARIDFVQGRIPELPSFTGDGKNNATIFETWRYDVKCLLDEAVYPLHIIRESIRKSLKGSARGVLLHLGEQPTIGDILSELDGIYGNVQSAERLREQFYSERQKKDESVGDYSLRLERLLSRIPGHLNVHARNDMLRSRLWSGLSDMELKNACRFLFDTVYEFNTLRKEIRAVEEDLQQSKAIPAKVTPSSVSKSDSSSSPSDKSASAVCAKQSVLSSEDRLSKEIGLLAKQLERMEARMSGMEREMAALRPNNNHLNFNRPPSQGR